MNPLSIILLVALLSAQISARRNRFINWKNRNDNQSKPQNKPQKSPKTCQPSPAYASRVTSEWCVQNCECSFCDGCNKGSCKGVCEKSKTPVPENFDTCTKHENIQVKNSKGELFYEGNCCKSCSKGYFLNTLKCGDFDSFTTKTCKCEAECELCGVGCLECTGDTQCTKCLQLDDT